MRSLRDLRVAWPHVGLPLVIAAQAAAVLGYAVFGAAWSVWAGLTAGLAIALSLAYIARRREAASLNRLAVTCRTLGEDCDSLSSALADLGRGNLEAHVTLQSRPIKPEADHLGDQAFREIGSTVNKLHKVAQEFNGLTAKPLRRLCYVGAESYLEGRICGDAMGRALGGQGQVAITVSYAIHAPIVARRKGFESRLRERYPGVQVVEVIETTFDVERGYLCGLDLLARYPDLRGIYVTDGAVGPAIGRAIAEMGRAGRTVVIAHDLVGDTLECLREGIIYATLVQNLFAQGHDSVIHLFNHLVAGWYPAQPRLLTPLQLVARDSCTHLRREEWAAGTGGMPGLRLAEPMQCASRPVRIAVQNRDASVVDQPLQMGAAAAAAKLRSYGAQVDILVGGTVSVESVVDSVVAQGYDAMTVLAANRQDARSLQRAAEVGVVLATYNAEPLSLAAWVCSMTDRVRELLGAGNDVDAHPQPADLSRLPLASGEVPHLRSEQHSAMLYQAIQFMHDNLEDPITVADVARHVALNPSYFCRLFTAQTGRNPSDYLIGLRVEQAKQYLVRGDMSVMDVCVALGYSPSYLSRLFKRRVGCTPGQYAQRAQRPRGH